MSGITAIRHVVSKLEQQRYTVTGITRNKTVPCPCGEGDGHSISLTYDKRQGAVYLTSDGDKCRYKDDTPALLEALSLTPDDLWNDGAWNKGGTPRYTLPDKPGTVRKAEDREHHTQALADAGNAAAPSPATPVPDGRRGMPGSDDARPDIRTTDGTQDTPDPKPLYVGVIPLCGFTLVYGEGGVFKSVLTRWVTAQVTAGKLPGEYNGTPAEVVIVHTCEDTTKQIRLQVERMGGDGRRLKVFDTDQYDDPLKVAKQYVERHASRVALMILDPVTYFADDVNDAKKVEAFVSDLNGFAGRYGIAVMGISHMNKVTDNPRKAFTGSAKWEATARSVVCIAKDPLAGPGAMVSYAKVTKCNGWRPGTKFAIHAGMFAPEGDGYRLDPEKYRATDTAPLLVDVGERQEFPYVVKVEKTNVDIESFDRNRRVSDDERTEAKEQADTVVAWIDAQPDHEAYRTDIDRQFTQGDNRIMSTRQLSRLLRSDSRVDHRKEKMEHGRTLWHVRHDGTGPNHPTAGPMGTVGNSQTNQTNQTFRRGESAGTVGNTQTNQTNQTFRDMPVPAQSPAIPMSGGKFGKLGEFEQSQGFPGTMSGGKFGKFEKSGDSVTRPRPMLMYGKEASNRKQEIDRQHYTIPNQRPKDKHCGKI
ncbi:AAA family ATPase [Bifidobacterium thermacidophilum]|uniref:AAA family ATPase n=1 Tax=Bifidobacterium thermacidophilum TaxID=246618 RepID=A0ABW8KN25_9BIFI